MSEQLSLEFVLTASDKGAASAVQKMIGSVNQLKGALGRGWTGAAAGFNKAIANMRTGWNAAAKDFKKNAKIASEFKLAGDGARQFGMTAINALKSAGKEYVEFEKAINSARVKLGISETSVEFSQLSKKAREIGASTMFSSGDAANAFREMAAAGVPVVDMMRLIGDVANVATIEGISLEEAYEGVSNTMSGFGLGVSETTKTIDTMSAAADASKASLIGISRSMKEAGSTASRMGISFEDAATMVGVLSQSGKTDETAGIAMRNVITRAAAPRSKFAKTELRKIGMKGPVDTSDMGKFFAEYERHLTKKYGAGDTDKSRQQREQSLQQVFQEESGTAGLFMQAAKTGEFKRIRNTVDAGGGGAAAKAGETAKTTAAAIQEMESAMGELKISMIEGLSPVLKDVIKDVAGVVGAMADFAKENPGLTKSLVYATALVGGLAMGASFLATTISAVMTIWGAVSAAGTFLGGIMGLKIAAGAVLAPLGLAAAAIAGIAAAAYGVYKLYQRFMNIEEESLAENKADTLDESAYRGQINAARASGEFESDDALLAKLESDVAAEDAALNKRLEESTGSSVWSAITGDELDENISDEKLRAAEDRLEIARQEIANSKIQSELTGEIKITGLPDGAKVEGNFNGGKVRTDTGRGMVMP